MKKQEINTVTKAMHEEHVRLEKLLHDYIHHKKNHKKAQELFKKFEWNLKKHTYMEEEVMFAECESSLIEEEAEELSEEHEEMMRIINTIKRKEIKDVEGEIITLQDLLLRHGRREEELLYEELEKTLNKEQKEKILKQTKDHL